jgi:glycosyltransferase involved in cell wall biosynthesis
MYNLTTTCRFGGVETFVWETSKELARRGVEVHILGGRGRRLETVPEVRVLTFPFWRRERIPDFGRRFRKLAERLSMGVFALGVLRRGKYDILHIHKPFDLPIAARAKKSSGLKVILGSHGTDFFPGDRLFAGAVDGAVCCSRYNGSLLADRYGIPPEVIYNGIDPRRFRPFDQPDPVLWRRFGFCGEDFVILYVGRLIGLKGVKVLLRAVSRMPRRERLKVVIAGEGEERTALEGLSGKLGLENAVFFPGFVPHEEVPRYFSLARAAAFPSLADEAFGISICEAMACGVPAIGTTVGGIPEVIEDGQTGLLVKPRDEEALARAIASLHDDEGKRRSMAERGRDRVNESFTWEKVTDRLLRVYEKVRAGQNT